MFDYNVCKDCSRRTENKASCTYRNMTLLQYLEHKNILYTFKNAGRILIDTSNLMNSSAIVELNNEIKRTKNTLKETGYDYKIVI